MVCISGHSKKYGAIQDIKEATMDTAMSVAQEEMKAYKKKSWKPIRSCEP
jgi:membrane protein insertase Oxa1/YidC/SpoIIIJ